MSEHFEIPLSELMEGLDVDTAALFANAPKETRGRGKGKKKLEAWPERELTLEEIEAGTEVAFQGAEAPQLQHIRDSHRQLAQHISNGKLKMVEIAQVTGYSVSRISVLKKDEAFKELVEHYRDIREEAFSDTVKKMKNVTDDALDILHDRLSDDPDEFTVGQLTEVVKTVGDRAGYSPVSKSISVTAPMDALRITALKDRVKERQHGEVKEITQEAINGEFALIEREEDAAAPESVGVENSDPITASEPLQETAEIKRFPREGNIIREEGGSET